MPYPVEIREIGNYNSPASSSAVQTFHEETLEIVANSRTLRSSVAAAINEAIGGTNADPVSQ